MKKIYEDTGHQKLMMITGGQAGLIGALFAPANKNATC